MTWHTFFSFDTMQNRHLLAAYGFVLAVQGGYLVWIVSQWRGTKAPRSHVIEE